MRERSVLIGLVTPNITLDLVQEHLLELDFLSRTAGAETIKHFIQRLPHPDKSTFLGKGKIQEVLSFVKENNIDLLIFDDELSSTQLRNIEKIYKCKILDRNNLILDIFASRAKTAKARTQVELAQYQYLLPRLTRMWTHLERQKGGIGMRGPGETQIETDRRIIKDKISLLKKKMRKIDKQSKTQSKRRSSMIRVSLVGYTNAGKSTLMNQISKSDVFAEDKLFATLDTTIRKVVIDNLPFLLADTVGFIRKLPHQLIESFKTTLDEVRESDLLLHVVDISNPAFEDHIQVVQRTISEIGASEIPEIIVFNKIDNFSFTPKEKDDLTDFEKKNISLEDLKDTWMARSNIDSVFISAIDKKSLIEFKTLVYRKVKDLHVTRYPYNHFLY